MSGRYLLTKNYWRKWRGKVIVRCPVCLREATLDHDVNETGDVDPSLDCPHCTFHEWVRLENWGSES